MELSIDAPMPESVAIYTLICEATRYIFQTACLVFAFGRLEFCSDPSICTQDTVTSQIK